MTPREQAALAVAHAEAALLDARKALREAVKAEIAAMPPLPDVAHPMVPCSACDGPCDPVVGLCVECDTDPNDAGRMTRESAALKLMAGSLFPLLGEPEIVDNRDELVAVWSLAPCQWVCLSGWHDGFRVEARCPAEPDRAEWRLSEMSLDAAIRRALTWLADRDVFVEVRK